MRISSSSMLEMPEMRADPSSLSLPLLATDGSAEAAVEALLARTSSGQGRERGLSSFPPSLHPSFLPSFLPSSLIARSIAACESADVCPPTPYMVSTH